MERAKSWELSEKDAKNVREKNKQILNDASKFMIYNEYVESQKNGFVAVMNFVNNKINDLIDKGKISEFIQVRGRIKSAESAINNDSSKALDDIFGMEIITATDKEITTILQSLTPYMLKTKCKNHDKPNGYKAKHKYWTFKSDKMNYMPEDINYEKGIPMIEFQFKTSEVYVKCNNGGTADHTTYKGETVDEIQKKYDTKQFNVFNTPTMWVSEKDDNGISKMRLLSSEETLKKLYPFLNINSKRGMNK